MARNRQLSRLDILTATLDLLAIPVVLVGRDGCIAYRNRAASQHVSDNGCLSQCKGSLTVRDPGSENKLGDAIRAAFESRTVSVFIVGPNDKEVMVWVVPLVIGLQSVRVAIFLREIDKSSLWVHSDFIGRYQLTSAEGRVLALITQGRGAKEAAKQLACSEATVRTHLQRLYAKTRTRSLYELVRLALITTSPVFDGWKAAQPDN